VISPALPSLPPAAAPPLAVEQHSLAHLLRQLFAALDARNVRYCVLHSWEHLPTELASDLDFAVHADDRPLLPAVLNALIEDGYLPLQVRNYAVGGYRFDLGWFEADSLRIAGLDFIFDYRYAGLILASSRELTRDRVRNSECWVASPAVEFRYLLLKKTLKRKVNAHQEQRLRGLLQTLGVSSAEAVIAKDFGQPLSRDIVDAIPRDSIRPLLPRMLHELRKRRAFLAPWNIVRYALPEAHRLLRRWLHPTGFMVVLLGPDGVGKDTVLAGLQSDLVPAFKGSHYFHWRPGFLWKIKNMGKPVLDPHSHPSRDPVSSIFYLTAFQLDYWFGYIFRVRPQLVRSGFVIFNRYLPDMLVDQQRYRYAGPRKLLETFVKILPGRPFYVVLDAGAECIFQRKSELPVEELQRQRAAYRDLQQNLENVAIADATPAPQIVKNSVTRLVCRELTVRNFQRYPEWLRSAEARG
jgi:thymidylate kinase